MFFKNGCNVYGTFVCILRLYVLFHLLRDVHATWTLKSRMFGQDFNILHFAGFLLSVFFFHFALFLERWEPWNYSLNLTDLNLNIIIFGFNPLNLVICLYIRQSSASWPFFFFLGQQFRFCTFLTNPGLISVVCTNINWESTWNLIYVSEK
jgi:hypothetical protein